MAEESAFRTSSPWLKGCQQGESLTELSYDQDFVVLSVSWAIQTVADFRTRFSIIPESFKRVAALPLKGKELSRNGIRRNRYESFGGGNGSVDQLEKVP